MGYHRNLCEKIKTNDVEIVDFGMIAPWRRITLKDMDNVIRNLTLFREARDKYAN